VRPLVLLPSAPCGVGPRQAERGSSNFTCVGDGWEAYFVVLALVGCLYPLLLAGNLPHLADAGTVPLVPLAVCAGGCVFPPLLACLTRLTPTQKHV
jgi:hypothetical protein